MSTTHDHRRRVLVFGATGFVGSHLCRRLSSQGWWVGGVSRSTPSDAGHGGVSSWVSLDAGVAAAVRAFAPHAVVNAAVCYGRSGEGLAEMVRVNTQLPLEIAEACEALECPRYVHIDTFSWKPRTGACMDNPYTHTKRLAGALLGAMRLNATTVALARLEFPYGPEDRPHKLIPTLLKAFADRVASFDMSDAMQRRDFIWIDDVTHAIDRMLSCELPRGLTEIEVGTGRSMSVRDFVEHLRDACGGRTEIRYGRKPRLPGEMEHSEADTAWLAKIGATPSIDVQEGCRRLAAARAASSRT